MTGTTDTNILADFAANLNNRYQMIVARLKNYQVQNNATASTVAGTQYYDYPLGITDIDDVVVTVGNVNYPLEVINSQHNWDLLNAIQIQAAAVPQFIFPRSPYLSAAGGGGYGIWPIPQQTNTITFYYHFRDRGLSIDDYLGGTVQVTNASGAVVGTSTSFTSAMVGRSFTVTDTTNTGWGYWYLVTAYGSATGVTIIPTWQGANGSGLTYRICQVPLLPEEAHVILVDGATADFYMGMRKDLATATWFNNKFWTGDGNNNNRDEGTGRIPSGLIGLIDAYNDRNNVHIVNRRPRINPLSYKIWATRLS